MQQISNPHRQSQIYDDLSSFLHIFKRAIINSEHISLNISKEHDCAPSLQVLMDIIQDINRLSAKYDSSSLCEIIEQITFSRFAYRLIEIIANCKNKYQYIANIPIEHTFEVLLREIENFLREVEKIRTFFHLVTFVKMALLKFVHKLVFNVEGKAKMGQDNSKMMEIAKKLNEEYHKSRLNERFTISNTYSFQTNTQAQRVEHSNTINEKKSKIIIASQTFSDIQKRFDKYRGLDLDFSHFRGSHFEVKSNYDSFYKEFFERNSLILTIITQYSQDFQSFKKRQGKAVRKNKIQRLNINDGEMSESQVKINANVEEDLQYENKETHSKGSSIILPFTLGNSKVLDKMKKVYVSIGKNSIKHNKNNFSSTIIKKKAIQSNHQSFVCSTDHKGISEIDQSMTNEAAARVKTQGKSERYDKSSFSESKAKARFILGDKIIGYMLSPGKMQLKTKYFQLNSIPSAKNQNSKNRVFLNSKLSMKHADKSKLPNWFIHK